MKHSFSFFLAFIFFIPTVWERERERERERGGVGIAVWNGGVILPEPTSLCMELENQTSLKLVVIRGHSLCQGRGESLESTLESTLTLETTLESLYVGQFIYDPHSEHLMFG